MVDREKYYSSKIIQDNLTTKDDLVEHFKSLGIQKGMVIYVQSALDYLTNVCGENRSIIDALQEVVGYEGTLVTNSFTLDNLDPLDNRGEAYEPYQVDIVREAMPSFHKKRSSSKNSLANTLMQYDGVFRSNHPTHSFLAWGKYAKLICDMHPLHFPLSDDSPLGKVCELNGYVLLLGMKCESADIFKMARTNDRDTCIRITSSPVEKKGRKSFIHMLDYEYDKKDLSEIQKMMEERQIIKETFIGKARCRLFHAKEAATLASAFYHTHINE